MFICSALQLSISCPSTQHLSLYHSLSHSHTYTQTHKDKYTQGFSNCFLPAINTLVLLNKNPICYHPECHHTFLCSFLVVFFFYDKQKTPKICIKAAIRWDLSAKSQYRISEFNDNVALN